MAKEKYKAHFLNDVFIEGKLRFPKLNEPDTYNPDKPCYKTGIIPEAADLARIKKMLVDFGHKYFPDADLWLPIKKDKKDDSIVFIEATTRKKDKDTGELKRPFIVDAKRRQIPVSVSIGGGTIAKIKVTAMEYEGTKLTEGRPGVALVLETVQVKVLKSYTDPLAGFSDEDGYDGSDAEQDSDIEGVATGEASGDAYKL
jgi:hypothetical protein